MSERVRIRPAGDYLVIEPMATPEKSTGGVDLPDIARYVPQQGTVLAVGPGSLLYDANGACIVVDGKALRKPMDYRVGDTIVFSGHAGVEVPIGGTKVLMVKSEEVLAWVEAEESAGPAIAHYRIAGALG
jgi:chaperonin GroES